jgi:hypothetical protein
MGLFSSKRTADPQDALKRAREALAATGTYVDEHGRRRKLTPEMRDDLTGSLDAAAHALATDGDLPIWPSGIARFTAGILEVTTDGTRLAARDITTIDVKPPRAGRLTLEVHHRAGVSNIHKRRFWVELEHEAALHALVARVRATSSTA